MNWKFTRPSLLDLTAFQIILLLFLSLRPAFCEECPESSFVIEFSKKLVTPENDRLLTKNVESSSQCARFCRSMPNCTNFNFLPSTSSTSGSNFECQLFSLNSSSQGIQTITTEEAVSTANKVCLEKKCLKRSFGFEKFPNRALLSSLYILKTFSVLLEECLAKCQNEPGCRSVFFNHETSLCQISKISINSVYNTRTYFKTSTSIDMYENNCIDYTMTPSGCTFMRVSGGGLKKLSDQVLHKIGSSEECEQLCLIRTTIADPCRSYTYDNSTSTCYLMWSSTRMLGRSPLENMNNNLTHGDLDDCVNFSLKCRESNLEVKASSMRLFVGKMMTKKQKKVMCEESYNGEYDLSSKFSFEKCGMEASTSSDSAFRGTVYVKEGSTNLVTIRDKILQVNCRVHKSVLTEEQSLSVKMNVMENNKTNRFMANDIINSTPATTSKPTFSLKILTNNSKEADTVQIGEFGWIVLTVKNSDDDFTVTNLVARDVNSGSIIKIIDSDGCVIRRDIVQEIRKNEEKVQFRINFSGFKKQTEIVYHAIIETCTVDCMPKCNRDLLNNNFKEVKSSTLSLDLPRHRMVRRSAVGEPRQLQLINDAYEVRGQRLTLLNPKKLPNEKKSTKELSGKGKIVDVTKKQLQTPSTNKNAMFTFENSDQFLDGDVLVVKKTATIASSFHHCFVEDITCLFTIVLASIQLFLLFSCILIMYCYFQQWRQFRHLDSTQEHHVEYYQFGPNSTKLPDSRPEAEVSNVTPESESDFPLNQRQIRS